MSNKIKIGNDAKLHRKYQEKQKRELLTQENYKRPEGSPMVLYGPPSDLREKRKFRLILVLFLIFVALVILMSIIFAD